MDVQIVILTPSGKQRTTTKSLPLLAGRSEEAVLRITQDCVSRRHCRFFEQDGQVFVRDLGSTNGTILDGQRIEPQADTFVRPGGVLKVGGATFRMDYGDAVTPAALPPPSESETETETPTVPLFGEFARDPGAAPKSDEVAWPEATDADPPISDGDLGDFFKSLS